MKNLLILILGLYVTAACGMNAVPKPALDGEGPLAYTVDTERYKTPETHSPVDWWIRNHPVVLEEKDFHLSECIDCHEVKESCNKCHEYVGARLIIHDGRTAYIDGDNPEDMVELVASHGN